MQADFFGELGQRVTDNSIYALRRKDLYEAVKNSFEEEECAQGCVVLFSAFEMGSELFRQDKTFFYYTGINEPGSVLLIDADGKSTLYLPNCLSMRSTWMALPAALINKDHKALGFDAVKDLGNASEGYLLDPYFSAQDYSSVVVALSNVVNDFGSIFTTRPENGHEYISARIALNNLANFIPEFNDALRDISSLIAESRRGKDLGEVEKIYRAVEVTQLAQEAAVRAIKHDVLEAEVQASLEYIMTASHARPSFPSIVATGKNGTVLHYQDNKGTLKNGELVVIDVGAELDNYCADITRTYPVSGQFTKRQKQLYTIVLETQEYIAGLAKPGMWLKNQKKADKSLHHLAYAFLEKCGYAEYFPHGIGHFLGLDVHDVGDYLQPLKEGDVITIEPGIYIPEEGIGIRIEDNYWITKDGVICLSEDLPKGIDEIEEFMAQIKAEEDAEESDDDYLEDEEEDEDFDPFH